MQKHFVVLTLALSLAQAHAQKPADWPSWRGPNRDAVSKETGLLSQWPEGGPPLLWRAKGFGQGFSSVTVANGRIYTMGSRDKVSVIAADIKDGSILWQTPIANADDPNCAPTVDVAAKLVFALTKKGDLVCLNSETGAEVWRKKYADEFGGRMMSGWGHSESPLVDGDRLIVTPGGDRGVMAAFNKRTGEIIWQTAMEGSGGAGYASPIISNGGDTANIPTPLVKDDYVFCSTGYGTGAALLKLTREGNGVKAEEVYFKNGNTLQNHHGGMVMLGDYVYMGHGHNAGQPVCVEWKTGTIKWGPVEGAGTGSAALLAADGNLYFRYQNHTMALVEATPDAYKLKGSFKLAATQRESWPHPVIYDKKLLIRTQDELLCYNLAK
jgi:outer membrane protein assembly factor BamB